MIRAIALGIAVCVIGCGASAADSLRSGLGLAARGVASADQLAAPAYSDAHDQALRESVTMDAYRDRMRAWDSLVTALRAAKFALLGAESVIDAGDESEWFPAGACVALALSRLREVARAVDLRLPATIDQAIDAMEGLGGVVCPDPS